MKIYGTAQPYDYNADNGNRIKRGSINKNGFSHACNGCYGRLKFISSNDVHPMDICSISATWHSKIHSLSNIFVAWNISEKTKRSH